MAVRTFDPQPIYMNVLPSATEWAVLDRVPEVGITCFVGKPGSFKTFATIDAACCMATGLDCWGQKVGPPRKVIYIAADAGRGVKVRIIAWILSHMDALTAAGVEFVLDADGRPSHLPNLLLYPAPVNLHRKDGQPDEVTHAIMDIKAKGLTADVLCVDTLFHSSLGARLTLPEELLPALGELQRLAEALEAKTCLLVHHTTKDGEAYFGTIAFLATIEALILFEAQPEDKASVRVSCIRIREGEAFEPFEIKLQKVKVKTERDKFGRDQLETLAVIPGTVAATPKLTKEKELFFMLVILELVLKNQAISTEWCKATGWPKRTFQTKRTVAVERGLVAGGGGVGEVYSTVVGWWGQPMGGTTATRESGASGSESGAQSGAGGQPHRGLAPLGTTSGLVPSSAGHQSALLGTTSSRSCDETKPVEIDLETEALSQLKKGTVRPS
jgi:hypothetical protein